mmetsp:Transcript_40866/g.112356  ORF Transcript_40866/g.112356 Transcript_40866/m.112356 type:complete len:263 (-) Transcript_40866:619-1407(-)
MDVGRTLVRVYGLEVANVPNDLVFVDDAVATKHIAACPGNVEGLRARVAFHHRDDVRMKLTLFLHARRLQDRIQTDGDISQRVRHFYLYELILRERAPELLAVHRVTPRSVHTEFSCPPRAPSDAEPGRIQASERATHARDARENVFLRNLDLVKVDHACGRRPQRELAIDLRGRQPLHAPLDKEPADLVVGGRLSPHEADVSDWRIRNPILRSAQQIVVALVNSPRHHAARVRAMIRLGQAEASDDLACGEPGQESFLLLL